jgi:hypothetical protein
VKLPEESKIDEKFAGGKQLESKTSSDVIM